jgi:hypothetical protein
MKRGEKEERRKKRGREREREKRGERGDIQLLLVWSALLFAINFLTNFDLKNENEGK